MIQGSELDLSEKNNVKSADLRSRGSNLHLHKCEIHLYCLRQDRLVKRDSAAVGGGGGFVRIIIIYSSFKELLLLVKE
jgi:hypothetical protein